MTIVLLNELFVGLSSSRKHHLIYSQKEYIYYIKIISGAEYHHRPN